MGGEAARVALNLYRLGWELRVHVLVFFVTGLLTSNQNSKPRVEYTSYVFGVQMCVCVCARVCVCVCVCVRTYLQTSMIHVIRTSLEVRVALRSTYSVFVPSTPA